MREKKQQIINIILTPSVETVKLDMSKESLEKRTVKQLRDLAKENHIGLEGTKKKTANYKYYFNTFSKNKIFNDIRRKVCQI